MSMSKRVRVLLLIGLAALGSFELGERLSIPGPGGHVPTVKAEVGRPLTPVSVAGVARRSARRN